MYLDFDPRLHDDLRAALQRSARRVGLSLDQLELLGQDATAATGFVRSVSRGRSDDFLARVDWTHLEARLDGRRAAILRAVALCTRDT